MTTGRDSGPMLDFFGRPLRVGQRVAYENKGYRELVLGKVVRFTRCFVVVTSSRTFTGEFRCPPCDMVIHPDDVHGAPAS